MKNFIKNNWFKLAIISILLWFGFILQGGIGNIDITIHEPSIFPGF